MSKTFKQYVKPWGPKYYRATKRGTSTYAGSGCGPSAMASIYQNYSESATPETTGEWLMDNGYATDGYGTVHAGINKFFEKRGIGCKWLTASVGSIYGKKGTTYEDAFKNHIKKDNFGIILFGHGTFTSSGHYISITAYDQKTKKYYLRDSGARDKDGWYSWSAFEKQIKHLWIINNKNTKKTETVKPKAKVETKVEVKAPTLKYATCDAKSGVNLRVKKVKDGKASFVDTGKNIAYNKKATLISKGAGTTYIGGKEYILCKIKYNGTEYYVAQKYFSFS